MKSYLRVNFTSQFSPRPRCSDLWKRIFACLISWLGACLQVRCPVWRLPDKRAQHTRATQKSTTHARHTKRDAWIYTGDITAAIAMRGRCPCISIASFISSSCIIHAIVCVCCSFVRRACCALLCGARVLCSFVGCKRQTCRQATSQEIRQAHIRFCKSRLLL